jgi:hypothetical protein
MSYLAIADRLNFEGVKSHSGKQWHPTQVQRIVQRAQGVNETRR